MRRTYRWDPEKKELVETSGRHWLDNRVDIHMTEPLMTDEGYMLRDRKSINRYLNENKKVLLGDVKDVVKDIPRNREYERLKQKKRRLQDIVNVVKGYGG